MVLRWAYSRNEPVAAHDSNVCPVFSGVGAEGGGVGRAGAERFEDEDCDLLCDRCPDDIMRLTVIIILWSV